jgi:hypothetical protein
MIRNTKEVVRTFGCSADLAHNISKDYVYLTITPFTKALMGLKQNHADSIANSVQSVQNQVEPLQQAFDGPVDEFQDNQGSVFDEVDLRNKFKLFCSFLVKQNFGNIDHQAIVNHKIIIVDINFSFSK